MSKVKYWLAAAISALTLILGMALPKAVGATPSEKVKICHATNSQTNPYTENDVDQSSVDEQNNKYLNGHGDHTGPVWYPGIANHSWGDIIPPFSYGNVNYPGQNWTSEGQAIWNNECEYDIPEEGPANIVFDVVCTEVEGKAMVSVTFKNFGASDGKIYLNGEEVEVKSGNTVVKYVDLGVKVTIVSEKEEILYDQTPDCVEEEPEEPQVLGEVTEKPVGGVSAGAGGASTSSLPAALGVLGSIVTLGGGLVLARKWSA